MSPGKDGKKTTTQTRKRREFLGSGRQKCLRQRRNGRRRKKEQGVLQQWSIRHLVTASQYLLKSIYLLEGSPLIGREARVYQDHKSDKQARQRLRSGKRHSI